jgi:enolase
VWDSRGRPTVEAEVRLVGGAVGRAIAPAGASRGVHEAIDLRDGESAHGGMGVERAIENVNTKIAARILRMDALDQRTVDGAIAALDGTRNFATLGGNASIATSMAVLQAAAASQGIPLYAHLAQGSAVSIPMPEIQVFGGGAHAGRRVDVQDFMVMPVGARSFDEALAMCAEVYRAAGELMREAGKLQGVADEGGYWPAFDRNEEALDMLVKSIERAGFRAGSEVAISLDIAASEFGTAGGYRLALEDRELDRDALCEMLLRWIGRYPIVSIEDPVAQDDDQGMVQFTRAAGKRVQVVGDDYLVSDAGRVADAAARGACNAALIKPNQAGTVSAALDALRAAKAAGWRTIVSARSGETEDVTIAHLAVGWNAGQLKVGSFARSERMAKWNEVLRIEEALGARASFAGNPLASRAT